MNRSSFASPSDLPVGDSFGLFAVATPVVEPAAVDDLPSNLPKADPIQRVSLECDDLFLSNVWLTPT